MLAATRMVLPIGDKRMLSRQLRRLVNNVFQLYSVLFPIRSVGCRNSTGAVRQYRVKITDHREFDRLNTSIFLNNEYDWSPSENVGTPRIIDVGGHIGMSVIRWKCTCPQAEIIVIEPNPSTVRILRRNIARNHLENIHVIEAAASSKDGTATLYMPKRGVDFRWGDFIKTQNRIVDVSHYNTEEVRTVRLSSLIDEEDVDLLKIDIEGSECEIIREAQSNLHLVKEIFMEFHNDPQNPSNSFQDVVRILRAEGFRLDIRNGKQSISAQTFDGKQKAWLMIRARRT
jgi:FkbM family methyltransferase